MKLELNEISRDEMDCLIDSFGESDCRLINSILCDKPSLSLDDKKNGIFRIYNLCNGILIIEAMGDDCRLYTADHMREVLSINIGKGLYNRTIIC